MAHFASPAILSPSRDYLERLARRIGLQDATVKQTDAGYFFSGLRPGSGRKRAARVDAMPLGRTREDAKRSLKALIGAALALLLMVSTACQGVSPTDPGVKPACVRGTMTIKLDVWMDSTGVTHQRQINHTCGMPPVVVSDT